MTQSLNPLHNTGQYIASASDRSIVTKLSPFSTILPLYSPSSQSTEIPSILQLPSNQPSLQPSTSALPSSSEQSFTLPSAAPSYMPSFIPTSRPGCPDQLLKSKTLDYDNLLTLKYEVVLYPADGDDTTVTNNLVGGGGGGLLCLSLEYTGDASVGWIGLAFSEASRDPRFGRKEAIIGIPGIETSVAVATDGGVASLGQQSNTVEGGGRGI